MPRPKKLDRPTRIEVKLPQSTRERLDVALYSEVEGRVPLGAYSTLIDLLVVIAIIGVLIGLLLPAVQAGLAVAGGTRNVAKWVGRMDGPAMSGAISPRGGPDNALSGPPQRFRRPGAPRRVAGVSTPVPSKRRAAHWRSQRTVETSTLSRRASCSARRAARSRSWMAR